MSDKREPTNIFEAMALIMQEVDAIGKDSTNKTQGFKYRGIDAVYNSLHPIMAKYGVIMMPEVLEKTREERATKNGGVLIYTILRIKYTFHHKSGTSVSCVVEGEGMDSGDKSANKAMSIAQKYALFQSFLIPTEEVVDPDAESHEVKPKNNPLKRIYDNAVFSIDKRYKEEPTILTSKSFVEWFNSQKLALKDDADLVQSLIKKVEGLKNENS